MRRTCPDLAAASMAALARPVSLVAIAALVVNDHFLKYEHPSWLTGKLSDFAGLLFSPYVVLAVLFRFAVFTRAEANGRALAVAAYCAIGAVFTMLKTTAEATRAVSDALAATTGRHVALIADPSDLIALASLPVSYVLWAREASRAGEARQKPRPLRRLVLLVAALAIVATSGPPRPIITSIAADGLDEGVFYAVVEYTDGKDGLYLSENGGSTWSRVTSTTGKVVADPTHAQTAYLLDAPSSQSGIIRLTQRGTHPTEIGPGRRLSGTYDSGATFLSIAPWTTRVFYFVRRGVLWISDDDGAVWQNIGLGAPVHAVAPAPTAGLVYAATDGYVMRSTDGGRDWRHVTVLPGTGRVTSMIVDRDDPMLVLASIGKQLWRSTDGGATWSARFTYAGTTKVEFAHWKIAADAHDPERIYALFGGGCCPVSMSTDRGLTWKEWGEAQSDFVVTVDAAHPLLAVTSSRGGLERHIGTPPGAWERIRENLPLQRR